MKRGDGSDSKPPSVSAGRWLRSFIFALAVSLATGAVLYLSYAEPFRTFLDPLTAGGPSTSLAHRQFNFHVIRPGIWRCSQPSPETLDRLKRHYGLKTLVNFRLPGESSAWEPSWAERHGVAYVPFPMNARVEQDPKALRSLLDLIQDPARQPVLLHCAAGKDRTGLVAALLRIERDGWTAAQALQEMRMYGYDEQNYPRLKEFLDHWSSSKPD